MKILKKSQIWVETTMYTLIGLTMISIVLTMSLPQIEKMKDRETIKQTIVVLGNLDQKIAEVREAPGSVRIYNLKISNGKIEINALNDSIIYKLENTRLEFSQKGEYIKEGDLIIYTEKKSARFNVNLILNLSVNTNITFNDNEEMKTLQPGSAQYNLKIINKGIIDSSGRYVVDIIL